MMTMNAPAVPTAAPATPASAAASASGAAGADVAAGDFLLMLGQLLGAPVAQTGTTNPAATLTTSTDEGDATEAAQDAAAVTGVPLPLMTQVPTQALTAAKGDVTLELTSTVGKSADVLTGRAGLDLPAELTSAKSDNIDAPATNNITPNLQSVDGAQQLRSAAVADTAASRPIQHHVGTSAWADEVGTRMIMMTERGQHSASLRLSPEHLGPLEVRIAVRDDQASVWFGAAHADTRAAIEQALPRLRELFASQGLSLADAGVHHQAPREQSRTPTPFGTNGLDGMDDASAVGSPIAIKLGLVDAYA
jgi:flagellar hook-length control protein FliK